MEMFLYFISALQNNDVTYIYLEYYYFLWIISFSSFLHSLTCLFLASHNFRTPMDGLRGM